MHRHELRDGILEPVPAVVDTPPERGTQLRQPRERLLRQLVCRSSEARVKSRSYFLDRALTFVRSGVLSLFLLVSDSISVGMKVVWFAALTCLAPFAIPLYFIQRSRHAQPSLPAH